MLSINRAINSVIKKELNEMRNENVNDRSVLPKNLSRLKQWRQKQNVYLITELFYEILSESQLDVEIN